jgi:hypothetical protein
MAQTFPGEFARVRYHRLLPLPSAAATVLSAVKHTSFANGGFEQHHRQESDGIKPEIGIVG